MQKHVSTSQRPAARVSAHANCYKHTESARDADVAESKLIRKQKTNAACEEASLYDCALRGECAPLYDCTQFSGVCLVFDDCLVKTDDSLTEAECKAKNVGEPGNFATTRWCR